MEFKKAKIVELKEKFDAIIEARAVAMRPLYSIYNSILG